MMAGNPNYWSMNDMHPQSHQLSNSQFVYGSNNNINININDNININNNNNSSSVITSDSTATTDHHQDFPVRSWSQLLLGGLASGEEELAKGLWEDDHHVLNLNNSISSFGRINHGVDVKQEVAQSSSCQLYDNNNNNNNNDHDHDDHYDHQANRSWAHHNIVMPVSSPTSCVTSLSNNFLNFSGGAATTQGKINQEHSSECNSTSSGGVSKKARVQQSSAQPALKVRKEKLGDRITALHQLVSPFGKTDTASVLSEAIGYIRFLQGQIEALSSPYMRNAPANSVQERNCLFPEEAATGQDSVHNLRSRGLCLVPISCTEKVGNDNGADYWAPAALGGGGF